MCIGDPIRKQSVRFRRIEFVDQTNIKLKYELAKVHEQRQMAERECARDLLKAATLADSK